MRCSLQSIDKEKPTQIHTEYILPQAMEKWSILHSPIVYLY